MSSNLENLPPEMQARIAEIVASGKAPVTAQPGPPPAPIQKPPSLMDHLIALRQEVSMMRQEMQELVNHVDANSNVVEAVGQAVGTIYQMFQQTSNPNPTYSQGFQQQQVADDGTDY